MGKKNWHGANTGNEFIQLAKTRGASVEKSGNFMKIKTPNGSMKMAPGDEVLDKGTISNIKRWFRLLGLMIFIGFPVMFILHFLRLGA